MTCHRFGPRRLDGATQGCGLYLKKAATSRSDQSADRPAHSKLGRHRGNRLFFKRHEQKKDLLRQHAENISTLVNDWYNQLHEIRVELKGNNDHRRIVKEIYFYVNNRLILPKLLLSISVLQKHKASRSLVRETEAFLRLVTDYNPEGVGKGINGETKCVNLLGGGLQSVNTQKSFDKLLAKLDTQLQKVTNETAKVLT